MHAQVACVWRGRRAGQDLLKVDTHDIGMWVATVWLQQGYPSGEDTTPIVFGLCWVCYIEVILIVSLNAMWYNTVLSLMFRPSMFSRASRSQGFLRRTQLKCCALFDNGGNLHLVLVRECEVASGYAVVHSVAPTISQNVKRSARKLSILKYFLLVPQVDGQTERDTDKGMKERRMGGKQPRK
jgi:hypothetical protein